MKNLRDRVERLERLLDDHLKRNPPKIDIHSLTGRGSTPKNCTRKPEDLQLNFMSEPESDVHGTAINH